MNRRMARRQLLRGLGAASCGPAFLDGLYRRFVVQAQGQQPSRRRLFTILDNEGWWASAFRPPSAPPDPTTQGSQKGFLELPLNEPLAPAIAPLQPLRSNLLLLEAFTSPDSVNPLHANTWPATTMMKELDAEFTVPGGISVDRRAAQVLGRDDAFDSLALAVRGASTYSADGAGASYPQAASPFALYQRLFYGVEDASDGLQAAERLRRDLSVLDSLRGPVQRMQSRLAAAEREKLEQYTTSLRGLEKRMSALAIPRCAAPEAARYGVDLEPTIAEPTAYAELSVHALACDLTHVVALAPTSRLKGIWNQYIDADVDRLGQDIYGSEWEIGQYHDNKHGIAHHRHMDGQARRLGELVLERMERFVAQLFADVASQLDAIADAEGTLLDNTTLAWFNVEGGLHHGGGGSYPAIVFDRSGQLNTGRYVSYPKHIPVLQEGYHSDIANMFIGERSVADFWLTVLHAVGVRDATFGDPNHNAGPLEELFA